MSDGPRMQDVLGRLVVAHVAPPLKAAGLRRQGRRTWYEQGAHGGWVLLELQVGRDATRDRLELTLNTVVWPPGTWEHEDGGGLPFVAGNAPVFLRPQALSDRDGEGVSWWVLDASTDADALGEELARTCVERALPRARALLDVDTALAHLLGRRGGSGLAFAVAMLERAAPAHPRRTEVTAAYVSDWLRDPRPITAGPRIARLLADVGLPPRELPVWWSPVLLPYSVETEHGGDPVAAWRASSARTLVHLADGSQQEGLPEQGLGPYGLRAEDLRRGRPRPPDAGGGRAGRRWPWSR